MFPNRIYWIPLQERCAKWYHGSIRLDKKFICICFKHQTLQLNWNLAEYYNNTKMCPDVFFFEGKNSGFSERCVMKNSPKNHDKSILILCYFGCYNIENRQKGKGYIIVNPIWFSATPAPNWKRSYYLCCVYAFISSFMAFPIVFTISLNPFDKKGQYMQAMKIRWSEKRTVLTFNRR